jgi:indolepyruvate ferredoxin oxidoreductase beta subunit
MSDHSSTFRPQGGKRILLAGTGGQGVITAARFLSNFFVERGHDVVSGQLHGMAQRGGAVQSTVLVDCGISPVIPLGGADIVLGFEPVETARTLPFLSAASTVFMNLTPVLPFALSQQFVQKQGDGKYPDIAVLQESIRKVTQRLFPIDAASLADAAGSSKAVNVVMLGCLFGANLLAYSAEEFLESVMRGVPAHVSRVNNAAFNQGIEAITANKDEVDAWG